MMKPDRNRLSIRLKDYDYSSAGAYFITIYTHLRNPVFGEIVNGKMKISKAGQIVWEIWKVLPERYSTISVDEDVIMPDHFNGIIIIHEEHKKDQIEQKIAHQEKLISGEQFCLMRRRMLLSKIIG